MVAGTVPLTNKGAPALTCTGTVTAPPTDARNSATPLSSTPSTRTPNVDPVATGPSAGTICVNTTPGGWFATMGNVNAANGPSLPNRSIATAWNTAVPAEGNVTATPRSAPAVV